MNTQHFLKKLWVWLASLYAGLLTLWCLIFTLVSFNQSGLNILNALFWAGAVFIGVLFGILPLIYLRFYTVLSWGIHIIFLLFLSFDMLRIGYLMTSDPLYLANNERIWGPGFHIMHFVLFGITSLFIYTLKHAVLRYIRVAWRKIFVNRP